MTDTAHRSDDLDQLQASVTPISSSTVKAEINTKTARRRQVKASQVFTLNEVTGYLRPSKVLKGSTEAFGPEGRPTHVIVAELALEVGAVREGEVDDSFEQTLEWMCPGITQLIASVRSDEERGGFDLTLRKSAIPQLTIDAMTRPLDGSQPQQAFHAFGVEISKNPKVKCSKDGEVVLVLKVRAKFKRAEWGSLGEHVDGDLWVSAAPSQVSMAEKTA